jgi:hypothetical protein
MIDLNFFKENPELAKNIRLEISGSDLIQYSEEMLKRAAEAEKIKETPAPEEYLTSEEMAKTLKISLVTLWSWDKKGITHPLYIGRQKRYRRSDLEKMLNQ